MENSAGAFPIRCRACHDGQAEQLRPLVAAAATALDLEDDLAGIVLCVDDLPEADAGWLRVDPVTGSKLPQLTVYCGWTALASDLPGNDPDDETAYVWEQAPPRGEAEHDFVPEAAAAFLYHQLLLARDLLRGIIVPDQVPASQAETFAVAWDVTVDGRLARGKLPGYAMAARRGLFSRLFSAVGVLLPHHWHIFQSLWDGGLTDQSEVLAALRGLPRL